MATRSVITVLVVASFVGACSRDGQSESASVTDMPAADAPATSGTITEPSTTEPPSSETEDQVPQVATTAPLATEPVAPIAERSITVGGMGADYGPPVRTIVDLGVSSRSGSVAESTAAASAAGDALIAALEASGVASRDIQTSQFNIRPYHGPPDYDVIAGYETTIGYRVTMRDLDELGAVLGRAVESGGDSVQAWSVRFEGDPEDHMAAARALAWDDVRDRAAATAAEIGEALGPVLDVHEKVLVGSPQGMWQGGEGDTASFDIPVSPGVVGVVVLLTVTYRIGD